MFLDSRFPGNDKKADNICETKNIILNHKSEISKSKNLKSDSFHKIHLNLPLILRLDTPAVCAFEFIFNKCVRAF